jgi:hypothetical protein
MPVGWIRQAGEKAKALAAATPGPPGDALNKLGEVLLDWPDGVPLPPDLLNLLNDEGERWLPAVEPSDALKAVAEAVVAAEGILGGAGLGVASGRVEVTLVVDVGGSAGARATFNLTLGPVTGA